MKLLCVYPPFPASYWGMEYSRHMVDKAGQLPPLGLLTVAALVPREWEVRLCDMQVEPLCEADLAWADVVFLSGMLVQRAALVGVARRARAAGKTVVCGGPYASALPDEVEPEVDCVVVGEAEELMPTLCAALAGDRAALPRRFTAPRRPDVALSPLPRFELLGSRRYHSMGVQWSRGCPFSCEFCDIIELYGRVPRMKSAAQLLAELDVIHRIGHRGAVFIVDDNFIGNKGAAKTLLRALAAWMAARGHPFDLYTEASINLAQDEELMQLMVAAGFSQVFVGIETPSKEALRETHKLQNAKVDLDAAVATIAAHGIEVMAGFIVGFDADDGAGVARQREWILRSPIPLAMSGLLMALPGTQLERRLDRQGRLRRRSGGDNFARSNFETRHDEVEILEQYARLLEDIYEPRNFYARGARSMELCPKDPRSYRRPFADGMRFLFASLWHQGVRGPNRGAYWRFLLRTLLRSPRRIGRAVALAIQEAHFYRYTHDDVLPALRRAIAVARAEAAAALPAPSATAATAA
jgi:radical SAM superfamily enzyme YgiQ (UPF0313 family)